MIADAWLEQEHGKPPVVGSKAAGEAAPPEWWSAEVEQGHNSIESHETFQWSVVQRSTKVDAPGFVNRQIEAEVISNSRTAGI